MTNMPMPSRPRLRVAQTAALLAGNLLFSPSNVASAADEVRIGPAAADRQAGPIPPPILPYPSHDKSLAVLHDPLTRRRHGDSVNKDNASDGNDLRARRYLKKVKDKVEDVVEEAEDYAEEAAEKVKDVVEEAEDYVLEAIGEEEEETTTAEPTLKMTMEPTADDNGDDDGVVENEEDTLDAAAGEQEEEGGEEEEEVSLRTEPADAARSQVTAEETKTTTKAKKNKNKKNKHKHAAATPAPTPMATEEATEEGSNEITDEEGVEPGEEPWDELPASNPEEDAKEEEEGTSMEQTSTPTPQPTVKYVSVPEEEVQEWEEEPSEAEIVQEEGEEEEAEEETTERIHDHTTAEGGDANDLDVDDDDSPTETAEFPPGDPEMAEEAIEVQAEEKAAKKVGGWAVVIALAGMVFTAWQVSENPDGVFASVCRLSITISGCVLKILLLPFKYLCGSFFSSSGAHHPISQAPDYREPYRGRGGMMEMA